MSKDVITFKGTKTGFLLTFLQGADFEQIEQEARRKLEEGTEYFTRGTVVRVAPDALKKEDFEALKRLFAQHAVLLRTVEPEEARKPEEKRIQGQEKEVAPDDAQLQQMLVYDKTLRGGQEINTRGSVLICGNVNPGAQVIAGGSIDIRGTCRGMVHAGAYGNSKAFIIADRLMPMQIRIANIIARSPDQEEDVRQAERASIKDGQIVIEPIER